MGRGKNQNQGLNQDQNNRKNNRNQPKKVNKNQNSSWSQDDDEGIFDEGDFTDLGPNSDRDYEDYDSDKYSDMDRDDDLSSQEDDEEFKNVKPRKIIDLNQIMSKKNQ